MDSETFGFLSCSEADLVEWRAIPLTARFVEYLQHERSRGVEAVFAHTKGERPMQAQLCAGMVEMLDQILILIHRQDPPPPAPEEEFFDAALPPSMRRRR